MCAFGEDLSWAIGCGEGARGVDGCGREVGVGRGLAMCGGKELEEEEQSD